ncbi:hypothetical protein [Thalassolituus marinus]|uniref:Uncharacterized protein n=1 Tax=Thalassolituus marinus TaxID=671053 RepID=A0ABS7ZLP4_9GAMM|nr:hypothetical protein [Thalassolituus marinus]MCA6062514.1 hypothetical protein [Thalassolituus marinus]
MLGGLLIGVVGIIIPAFLGFLFTAVRKALKEHKPAQPSEAHRQSAHNPFMQSMTAEDWSAFELIVKTVRDTHPEEPDKGIFLRNAFKASLANRPTPQGELYPCVFGNFGKDYAELFRRFEQAVNLRLNDLKREANSNR